MIISQKEMLHKWMTIIIIPVTSRLTSCYQPHSPEKKKATMQILRFGTNNSEFGFDYLRDNMVSETDGLVQKIFTPLLMR